MEWTCPDCGRIYGSGDTVIVARGYSWCPACADLRAWPGPGKLVPETILIGDDDQEQEGA